MSENQEMEHTKNGKWSKNLKGGREKPGLCVMVSSYSYKSCQSLPTLRTDSKNVLKIFVPLEPRENSFWGAWKLGQYIQHICSSRKENNVLNQNTFLFMSFLS